jgi:hypothetical protein
MKKMMPLLMKGCDVEVPFDLLDEDTAKRNHSQSLDRLAERGGLCASEMLAVMDKRSWHKMNEAVAMLELKKRLENLADDEWHH